MSYKIINLVQLPFRALNFLVQRSCRAVNHKPH